MLTTTKQMRRATSYVSLERTVENPQLSASCDVFIIRLSQRARPVARAIVKCREPIAIRAFGVDLALFGELSRAAITTSAGLMTSCLRLSAIGHTRGAGLALERYSRPPNYQPGKQHRQQTDERADS